MSPWNLIRVWIAKYEAGACDDEFQAAGLLQQYEAKIAALEQLVVRHALQIEFLKGLRKRTVAEKRAYIRRCRPRGMSVARRLNRKGVARSALRQQSVSPTSSEAARFPVAFDWNPQVANSGEAHASPLRCCDARR